MVSSLPNLVLSAPHPQSGAEQFAAALNFGGSKHGRIPGSVTLRFSAIRNVFLRDQLRKHDRGDFGAFPRSSFQYDESYLSLRRDQTHLQRVRAYGLHREKQLDKALQRSVKEVALELLEWHRVCQIVAGFAGTESAKELLQVWAFPSTKNESEDLLSKTNAGVEALSLLGTVINFDGLQTKLVGSCIKRLERGFVINGQDAVAIATVAQFSYSLQRDVNIAIQEKKNLTNLIKPLIDMINAMAVHQEVFKEVWKVVDVDGVVKDSASSELQNARAQERALELRLQEMLTKLLTGNEADSSVLEVSNVNGRLCIRVSSDDQKMFAGLLLQSATGGAVSYIEPIAAITLNDKLIEARASVSKAEYDALCGLTSKLLPYLSDIGRTLDAIIELDMVVARAKYSLSFGGTRPIFTSDEEVELNISNVDQKDARGDSNKGPNVNWNKGILLQLREAYHPLLLHQYQEHLAKARVKGRGGKVEVHRIHAPVPINVYVRMNTKVVTITGPNTGGKTAAIKTVGLAALMAKAGLYILAADPVYIPWFDAVYADIGDEQSLSQSLSTFSGHLQRISGIKADCTSQSLVLLDEVGAGTNPVEGAALGMALLESFADQGTGGSLLTFATTHHGELKTLKYRDNRFENASVEFDEEHLKPTFRLLLGIPGRSNALNIAERLGIPRQIITAARKLHGEANAEINQIIMELENAMQELERMLPEVEHYLEESKVLYGKLTEAMESLKESGTLFHLHATHQVLEAAHSARSALSAVVRKKQKSTSSKDSSVFENSEGQAIHMSKTPDMQDIKDLPQVGKIVYVRRLGRKAKVLQVSSSRNEVIVQSGNLQIRLNQNDI